VKLDLLFPTLFYETLHARRASSNSLLVIIVHSYDVSRRAKIVAYQVPGDAKYTAEAGSKLL